MLPFNHLPFEEFDVIERFHLAKNRLQEIRVSDLIHKEYDTKLIDIRLFHNKTNVFQRDGIRFDRRTWNHFISVLKEIDPSELEIISNERYQDFLNRDLYDYDNIKMKIKTTLWPKESKKPNRGLLIAWITPEGNLSYPNVIFLPIGKVSEFVLKAEKSENEQHIIDDNKLISLINYNLEKCRETELLLRKFVYDRLNEHYGNKWYKMGLPQGVRIYIEEKERDEQRKTPWKDKWTDEEVMQSFTTGHLKDIIINKKNFVEIFSKYLGCSIDCVRINLENFISLRNNWAHIKEYKDTYLGLSGYSGMIYLRKCLRIE